MRSNLLIGVIGIAGVVIASGAWAQGTAAGESGDPSAGEIGAGDAAGAATKAGQDAAAKEAGEKASMADPAADAASTNTESAPEETSASQAPPVANAADGAAGTVQLKALEQRVNQLKEKIFRSKARLNLLKETVLHGLIAGSRAVIRHKNEMGGTFRMTKLVYALDGTQIYSKSDDSGALDDKREFDVFNGSIVPGNHTITTLMVFRGHGFGIFTYLKGYRFTVRASHTFLAAEGRQNVIVARAHEKGTAMTELRDRPEIKFESSIFKVSGKQQAKGEGEE